jgi:hypothetical protein
MFFEPQPIFVKIIEPASTIDWIAWGGFILSILVAIGSIITFFWNQSNLKKNLKIKSDEFNKNLKIKEEEIKASFNSKILEIKNRYSEILVLKRIESYTRLIGITQDIGKNIPDSKLQGKTREEADVEIRILHENAYGEIKKWEKDGNLLFCETKTYKKLKSLKESLDLRGLSKSCMLNKDKLESVFKKRSELRKLLQEEIGILDKSHKDIASQ